MTDKMKEVELKLRSGAAIKLVWLKASADLLAIYMDNCLSSQWPMDGTGFSVRIMPHPDKDIGEYGELRVFHSDGISYQSWKLTISAAERAAEFFRSHRFKIPDDLRQMTM